MHNHSNGGFAISVNSIMYRSDRQTNGAQIREAANIPPDHILFLKMEGQDREIGDNDAIDLAPEEIEEFYSLPHRTYPLKINAHPFIWKNRYISGTELRLLGGITIDEKLFWTIQGPDEEVKDNQQIDLARRGVEEFYSVRDKPRDQVILTIETTKGKWKDQPFPLPTTIADLIQQVINKFHFAQDGNYQIKVKGAGQILEPARTLKSYDLPDCTVLSFTDLGKGA